jgi:hypothetical protein
MGAGVMVSLSMGGGRCSDCVAGVEELAAVAGAALGDRSSGCGGEDRCGGGEWNGVWLGRRFLTRGNCAATEW